MHLLIYQLFSSWVIWARSCLCVKMDRGFFFFNVWTVNRLMCENIVNWTFCVKSWTCCVLILGLKPNFFNLKKKRFYVWTVNRVFKKEVCIDGQGFFFFFSSVKCEQVDVWKFCQLNILREVLNMLPASWTFCVKSWTFCQEALFSDIVFLSFLLAWYLSRRCYQRYQLVSFWPNA